MAHFKKLIIAFGEKREIIGMGLDEFLDKFKTIKDYDNVDLFFVDLELGPGVSRRICDIHGLDTVLPKVRSDAPWIPVACISRFISGDPRIIGDLSVSDFDGFYPKEVIVTEPNENDEYKTHPDFNQDKWEKMICDISIKRLSNMLGLSVNSIHDNINKSMNIELIIDGNISDPIIKVGVDNVKRGINIMSLCGNRYSISEVTPGFSGLYTTRLSVYGSDSKGDIRSYWFLKWGCNIRKLQEEANAHDKMFRRGIDRRLQIPLLYKNVCCWDGIGYIAYAFEEKATTALTYLKDNGIKKSPNTLRLSFLRCIKIISH